MHQDAYLIGGAWLGLDDSSDLQLDEAVFEASTAALRDAGVRRHQVDLAVTSSLDLYDGRSISSALTTPAAAGYLNDETRIEGDAGSAFLVAAAGLLSNHADVALVVAINAPEVGTTDEASIRRLREQISSYTFDSHFDRPVGMSAAATFGMHAGKRVDKGDLTIEEMAAIAAEDITRGSRSGRGIRPAVTADDVLASPMAASPLTELMLPAESAGVAVVVLAGGLHGRRSPRIRGRLSGWGSATAGPAWNSEWLDPTSAPAAIAADKAYRRAGLSEDDIGYLEMTDLTPALTGPLRQALRTEKVPDSQVNRFGGVRSSHPGIADGLLRIIQASEALADLDAGSSAVVHTTGDLMGLVSATTSVLVLEAQ